MNDKEDNKIVSMDYKKECARLKEEICKLKEKSNYDLQCNDEKWRGIVNAQTQETAWLKKVISGILHI